MKDAKRGVFILLEGVDRCGKTTQTKLLHEYLNLHSKFGAKLMHFPNRSTSIGKLIHDYLSNSKNINDQAVHLLFSANRWEMKKEIVNNINNGIHVVADRYSYSGMAFSSAKCKEMDLKWCKGPEMGLPKPDIVFYLNGSMEVLCHREDFGNERYEQVDFQNKVKQQFNEMMEVEEPKWKILDATKSIEQVHMEIKAILEELQVKDTLQVM